MVLLRDGDILRILEFGFVSTSNFEFRTSIPQPLMQFQELLSQSLRQFAIKLRVIACDIIGFAPPTGRIYGCERSNILGGQIQAGRVEAIGRRQIANRRLLCFTGSFDPFANPFQDAAIVAVTRPQHFAGGISAEPIDEINFRQPGAIGSFGEREPVREVVRHIVSTEGQHRERIAPQNPGLTERGRRRFRAAR